ncbi:MAG: hypothetical protein M0R80_28220, partial [Proteobacteria bacterium]|nr:hypothetical protein [Pseudomonadota bacterium]
AAPLRGFAPIRFSMKTIALAAIETPRFSKIVYTNNLHRHSAAIRPPDFFLRNVRAKPQSNH